MLSINFKLYLENYGEDYKYKDYDICCSHIFSIFEYEKLKALYYISDDTNGDVSYIRYYFICG